MAEGIDIAALAGAGVAIVVATRDVELRPELSRAWGPELSADGKRLRLCVEGPPDSPTARNLAAGGPAAAYLSRLATRTGAQVRGDVLAAGAPTPERLAAVDAHVERFVAEAAAVGVPEATARSLVGPGLVDVTIAVTETGAEP